jgi:hypothetical protein
VLDFGGLRNVARLVLGCFGMLTIHKRVVGYAYPKSGNAHNTTERAHYEVWCDGRLIDQANRLKELRKEYPDAIVSKDPAPVIVKQDEYMCTYPPEKR